MTFTGGTNGQNGEYHRLGDGNGRQKPELVPSPGGLSSAESCASVHFRKPSASLYAVTVNIITGGLGSGILSLPWAMAGASVFASVGTIVLVMALNVATVMILVQAAERYHAFDLGALLGHLPGRSGTVVQFVCNIFTVASVFLCLVSYVVAIADSLEPFALSHLGMEKSSGQFFGAVRAPLLALGALGCLPLCFMDQSKLAFSSTLGILVTIYLVTMVVVFFIDNGVKEDCCLLGFSPGTITMYSTLMQCAIIQMCVLPMYEELEDRSPRRFGIAMGIAFTFLAFVYVGFSALSYFVFGTGVHSNVVEDFPADIRGSIARLGVVVSMLSVYPIIANSMVAPVRHWEEFKRAGSQRISYVFTVLVVAASGIAAAFSGELGSLNQINGAMQVSCFIGLAPGLTGLYLLGREGTTWSICMYVLIAISIVSSVIGMTFTENDPEALTKSCNWLAAEN